MREFNKMSDIDHVSTHPCHRLSIPSARVFWCRHCMQQFEDPISRWRHSKTCKPSKCPYNMSQKVDKEADALRLATGGQVLLKTKLDHTSASPDRNQKGYPYQCYICKQVFDSLQRMRMHVRYPCNRVGDVQSPPLEAEDEYVISTRKREADWETKFNMFCNNENVIQEVASVPVHVIANETCEATVGTSSCNFYPAAGAPNVKEEHVFVPCEEQIVQVDHEQPDIMSVCETVVSSSPDENTSSNHQKVITVQGIEVNGTTDELYLSELLMQLSRGGFLFQNDANKDGTVQSGTQQGVEVVIQQPGEVIEQRPGDIQVVIEEEQIPQYIQSQNVTQVEVDDAGMSYRPEQSRADEQYTDVRDINSPKTNQLRLLAAVTQNDLHQIEQNQVTVNHMSNTSNIYQNRNISHNYCAFSSGEQVIIENPENVVSNQLSLLASVTSERLQSVVSEKTEPCFLQGEQNTVDDQHQESSVVVSSQEEGALHVHSETDAKQQDGSNLISVQNINESCSAQCSVLSQENSTETVPNNDIYNSELVKIEESQKRKHCDDDDDSNKRHEPESVL